MTIQERLEQFILLYYKRKKDFCTAMGIRPDALAKYTVGRSVFQKEIDVINLTKLGLNYDWYLTGNGEMLTEGSGLDKPLITFSKPPNPSSKNKGLSKRISAEEMSLGAIDLTVYDYLAHGLKLSKNNLDCHLFKSVVKIYLGLPMSENSYGIRISNDVMSDYDIQPVSLVIVDPEMIISNKSTVLYQKDCTLNIATYKAIDSEIYYCIEHANGTSTNVPITGDEEVLGVVRAITRYY